MPLNFFRRNQDPEPVRPGSQVPARGTSGDAAPIENPLVLLAEELTRAQEDAARWKRHADSYDQDRARAVEALAEAHRDVYALHSETAHLLAWLSALHPASAVMTPTSDEDPGGAQVLYIEAGGWQMSWHIHPRDAELFKHVTVVDVTDPRAQWDGHGSEQKYERMRNHVRLLALDGLVADEASTGVTDGPEVRSA